MSSNLLLPFVLAKSSVEACDLAAVFIFRKYRFINHTSNNCFEPASVFRHNHGAIRYSNHSFVNLFASDIISSDVKECFVTPCMDLYAKDPISEIIITHLLYLRLNKCACTIKFISF